MTLKGLPCILAPCVLQENSSTDKPHMTAMYYCPCFHIFYLTGNDKLAIKKK